MPLNFDNLNTTAIDHQKRAGDEDAGQYISERQISGHR